MLEQNKITFVPPLPMVEARPRLEPVDKRKLSIGSASIFDEDLELVAGQRLLVTTQLAMKVNISYKAEHRPGFHKR